MTLIDLIASVERTPLRTPFVTALRRVEAVESIKVTLMSASGTVGIGEAPPTVAITGEDTASIVETLKKLRPAMLHQEFSDVDQATEALHGALEGHGSAKAAVDMALYDLFSKEAGVPLYAFLGGGERPLFTDVTISLNVPEMMARDAARALQNGFGSLKVKVGGRDGLDVERLRAVRNAVGGDAALLVDANQAWEEAEALRIIEEIAPLNIVLVEQPLPAEDLEGMCRVTRAASIPILADESAFTLEEVRRVVESGAADCINVKLMKCGGVSRARHILEYCRDAGVACMMGSMLEGPYSIAAAMHLSMAYPDTVRWHDLDSPLLYRSLNASAPVGFEGDRLFLRHSVGL